MSDADRAPPAQPPQPDDAGARERVRLLDRHGRRFSAGETLVQEGAPAREAFVLHEGRVRVLRRIALTDRSLAVLSTGGLFGESALLEGTTYGSTAVALTDGAALAFDREAFRAMLARHPEVAIRVVEQLAMRLRDAEDQTEITMLRGAQSKVAGAILKLVGRGGATELTVSPVELSARVGLDVDSVRRTVQRLRDRNYLRITGERIEIVDVEALRRLYVLLGTRDDLAGPEA